MTELSSLDSMLTTQERSLERRIGEAHSVANEGKAVVAEIAGLERRLASLEEAIGVLNSFADARQGLLQSRIETLITHGLRTIFEDDLSFHIKTTQRGKLTAMEFVVRSTSGGQVVETPVMDARGGGVAAIAGFLLRLILLLLQRENRPVLMLDESFAQLSAEYEPKLADFMRTLVDRTRAQIILVTHSPVYEDVADVAYRLSLEDGVTKVAKL